MRVSIATSFVCVSFALLAAACWLARPADAFVPNRWLLYVLRASHLDFSSSTTHKEMSRNAILQCAVELLKDHPHDPQSAQRIMALGAEFDEEDLITAYHGERRRECTEEFEDAIETIEDANEDVDLGEEETVAAAHFDSEAFQSGQNRLVQLRENVVTNIRNRNFQMARRETGRLFHSLQDFYSHSNWIEMGNREPYSVLGQPGERPENIASPNTPTCTNCERRGRVSFFYSIVLPQTASRHYRCADNIRSEILDERILTSGYYTGQVDSEDNVIEKSNGKCSHGGFGDPSSDLSAKGGINKDSAFYKWSPHHSLHSEAARVAQRATAYILKDIRKDVGNDKLFAEYLCLCVRVSVSFTVVIDTTGSMGDELPSLLAPINSTVSEWKRMFYPDTQIRHILVPFNDPDVGEILETEDLATFLNGIASLQAVGGCDTPEPSIGALIRAIEVSEPRSPIFVFTDAPASDSDLVPLAVALIAEKSVAVFYALMTNNSGNDDCCGDCCESSSCEREEPSRKKKRETDNSYDILAAVSGGSVMNIDQSDTSQMEVLVSFSTPRFYRTILRASGTFTGSTFTLTFPVDSTVDEVIVTASAGELAISLLTPAGTLASSLAQYSVTMKSTTAFRATVNTTDSTVFGEWQIVLQGSGSYVILVSVLSDLRFSSELLVFDPSRGYGFRKVVGKPQRGKQLAVIFQALNYKSASLTVDAINLVDPEGTVLQSIDDVVSLGDNMFVGNFTPPAVSTFHWQISGQDEEGYSFSRISDTAIEVSDIDLKLGKKETGLISVQSGENVTVPLTLQNNGSAAQFSLVVKATVTGTVPAPDDSFEYSVVPDSISVETDASVDAVIRIHVHKNAPNGLALIFTVVANSVVGDTSDFVTFQLLVSTRPPPEFTENSFASLEPSSGEEPGARIVILLPALLIILMQCFMV